MGRLGRPHGLDGFMGLYVDPENLDYFAEGSIVRIHDRPHVVRSLRRADKGYQVAFAGVEDRVAAEAIRNSDVFVSERLPLTDDEFWPEDLIGLVVRPIGGVVVGVEHGPGQDRLVIAQDDKTFEIPFVAKLVPVVDIAGGYIEIVELPGLIPPTG